ETLAAAALCAAHLATSHTPPLARCRSHAIALLSDFSLRRRLKSPPLSSPPLPHCGSPRRRSNLYVLKPSFGNEKKRTQKTKS
ncbi:hypothetical protein LINPERPRIM_LOCUS8533, partial [Linum perenne]